MNLGGILSLLCKPSPMPRGAKSDDYRKITDGQGAFSFDPKPGAHTVVAVGLAGLGQARRFDFSKAAGDSPSTLGTG